MIRFRGRSVIALAGVLLAASPSGGAEDPLARRTYANADQLMREGKVEQALKEFEQVANAYPESDVADDALYRMGAHYYPAESIDKLGGAPPASLKQAKEFFTKITAKYPREDTAPRALLKLGLIAMDPANPERNLDEAYASFSGVVNIHPGSDVVDRALLGAGYADFLAARYDKAIGSFVRAAEEYPRGPAASDARYYMGLAHARQGAYVRAMEELQLGRDLYPQAPVAERSFDLVTRLFKMKMLPEVGGKRLFEHDPAFAPVLDPAVMGARISLAVDSDGVIHLLDLNAGALVKLGSDGKSSGKGTSMPGARSIAIDAADQELIAAGTRFRAGAAMVAPTRQKGAQTEPFESINAAAGMAAGVIALLDEEENEILLYTGDPAKLKTLYRDPEGRVRMTGLALGAEGNLYTIDRRGRRVLEIRPNGNARAIASTALQEPAALAANDLGELFVLDRRARSIVVMTAEGKTLETIVSQPATPGEFSEPTALAVGPRAEIYVHDAKRRTIVRFH